MCQALFGGGSNWLTTLHFESESRTRTLHTSPNSIITSLNVSAGYSTHFLLLLLFQVDSPLNLKHPHDVVIFMRQEARVDYLKKLEVRVSPRDLVLLHLFFPSHGR